MQASLETLLYQLPPVSGATLVHDALVLVHLLAMAVGLGTVAFCDYSLLRGLNQPVQRALTDTLGRAHGVILGAMAGLWISGATLIWMGLDPADPVLSDKVQAKLVSVTALSLTAAIIGGLVLPFLRRRIGIRLAEIRTREKVALAVAAALSMGGWASALVIGGFDPVRQAGPAVIWSIPVALHAASFALMFGLLGLHLAIGMLARVGVGTRRRGSALAASC